VQILVDLPKLDKLFILFYLRSRLGVIPLSERAGPMGIVFLIIIILKECSRYECLVKLSDTSKMAVQYSLKIYRQQIEHFRIEFFQQPNEHGLIPRTGKQSGFIALIYATFSVMELMISVMVTIPDSLPLSTTGSCFTLLRIMSEPAFAIGVSLSMVIGGAPMSSCTFLS
jgi:hypothetical protein